MPDFFYPDYLVLCGELEEDLRAMALFWYVGEEVRKSMQVILLGGEEGLECEVHVDRIRLEHVLVFKYLGCVLDESDTDEVGYSRMVVSRRRVVGTIRSLVNAKGLQLV